MPQGEENKRYQRQLLRRNLFAKVEKNRKNKKIVVIRDLKTNKKLYSERGNNIKQLDKYDIEGTVNTFQITKKKKFSPKENNRENLKNIGDKNMRGGRVLTAKLNTQYISTDIYQKKKTRYISSKGYTNAKEKEESLRDIENKLNNYQLERNNISEIMVTNIKNR
jgi:hypothetical protein